MRVEVEDKGGLTDKGLIEAIEHLSRLKDNYVY